MDVTAQKTLTRITLPSGMGTDVEPWRDLEELMVKVVDLFWDVGREKKIPTEQETDLLFYPLMEAIQAVRPYIHLSYLDSGKEDKMFLLHVYCVANLLAVELELIRRNSLPMNRYTRAYLDQLNQRVYNQIRSGLDKLLG